MLFQTYGDRKNPAVLFFHAMDVTGLSGEPVAKYLQDTHFCILPTSTVYCKGQKYVSKADEVRQVEEYLKSQGVGCLNLVVASSLGADLAMALFDKHGVAYWTRFLRRWTVCSNRERNTPDHDAVFVFCHQEPVLVEGQNPFDAAG